MFVLQLLETHKKYTACFFDFYNRVTIFLLHYFGIYWKNIMYYHCKSCWNNSRIIWEYFRNILIFAKGLKKMASYSSYIFFDEEGNYIVNYQFIMSFSLFHYPLNRSTFIIHKNINNWTWLLSARFFEATSKTYFVVVLSQMFTCIAAARSKE